MSVRAQSFPLTFPVLSLESETIGSHPCLFCSSHTIREPKLSTKQCILELDSINYVKSRNTFHHFTVRKTKPKNGRMTSPKIKTRYADRSTAFHFTALSSHQVTMVESGFCRERGLGFAWASRWFRKPKSKNGIYSPQVTGIFHHLLITRNIKQFPTFPLNEWDSTGKP